MSILSAKGIPVTSAPLNADVSDFPGLAQWFRFEENTGTALTDAAGNVSSMTLTGAGSHWAAPHCVTLTGTNPDYSQTLTSNVGHSAPAAGDVVIVEVDAVVPTGGGGTIIDLGRLNTGVQSGLGAIQIVNSIDAGEVRTAIALRNTGWNTGDGPTTSIAFQNNAKTSLDIRHKWCHVIDLTGSVDWNTIPISTYVDNVQKATLNLDTTAYGTYSAGNFMAGWYYRIGCKNTDLVPFTGTIYNLRIWILSSLPSNLTDIVEQMYKNPNELPPLLEGIS